MLNSASKLLGQKLEGFETPGLQTHGYSGNRRVDFMDLPLLGEGGEGWVVDASPYRKGEVLKLLKPPQMVPLVELAEEKWDEYPRKLPQLMELNLPAAAVQPTALVTEKRTRGSRVLGFFLPKVRGVELSELTTVDGRRQLGITRNDVMQIFRGIEKIDSKLHQEGIILGDKKPQNYIVKNNRPHVIDLESASFGDFECHGFTEQYIDPLLCNPELDFPEKNSRYTRESDHYAFEVMLFECLCGISPFGGIYRSDSSSPEVPEHARSLRGISVFHEGVGLPDFVESFSILPEALREHFRQTFEEKHRGIFPSELLKQVWKLCDSCALEHAKNSCPECQPFADSVFLQRNTSAKVPVQVETIPLPGVPALTGVRNGEPYVVSVLGTEQGPALYINHDEVLREVDPGAGLATAPSPSLLFLADQASSVNIITTDNQKRWNLRDVGTGLEQPLIASSNGYFAYIDKHGDLVLSTEKQMPNCCTFPLGRTEAEYLSIGQKLIGLADPEVIQLLQVQPDRSSLSSVAIPIDSKTYVLSLEIHPTLPFLLATFAHHDGSTRSCSVHRADGSAVIRLQTDKETRWWFSDEIHNGQPALLYWQANKLCEAAIDVQQGTLLRRWGLEGIPRTPDFTKPLVIGDYLYFVASDRVHRLLLTEGGTT